MLVIIGILLIFGLVVRHKWQNGAAKKEEILKLVAVASEEEAEIAQLQAIEEYNSHPNPQLETQHYCAVCHCPTTTRCSRCKAVRYCSGKCQIIHWRQGHKDDCRPALELHARKKSEGSVGTTLGHQFEMHLNGEAKICSDPNEELDNSRSSGSLTSCFFSSTERSETSFDASISEDVELGTPTRPDKTPSVGNGSHMSQTITESDDVDVPNTSLPVHSVNPPWVNKIEKTQANKIDESVMSTRFKDKREGDGVAVMGKFVPDAIELGIPQSTSPVRTFSAEDWENEYQTSTSKVMRSAASKASGGKQMPNVEMSSEYSKSLKMPPTLEHRKNELCNSKEARPMTKFRSSANFQKLPSKIDSPRVISLDIEGVRNLSQSSGKGLKTVWKFAQHFRAQKQSKSCTFDMLKDSCGNHDHKVLFPIKLFLQLYSCDDVGLHPFGLVNCGNSCYANAVLQCLIFTRPITSYLLRGLHSKTCQKRNWCFICKFEHLVQKGQETNSPLSPVGLLSQIQPIGREEDAHEFLRNVVDKMQFICLEEAGVSGSLAEDSTLMGLTFGGYLRSKIKCMKCLGRSEQCDRILDLTVEIDGNIFTLDEALAQFTTSETLGGDDKYKCNRCNSYEKAKKKLTILEAPNILTIVLKRFQSGNLQKLNKLVQFPEVLNLSPYMSALSDKYPTYHLYAVVVHLGMMNAAYSGHYVSYVKDFQGNWFRIDDSRVSHVNLETVLSVEAYVLFYARHTPRGASFVRNSSVYSDGKTRRNMEAISSNNAKKKNSKTRLSSSGRNTESSLPHHWPDKQANWMSPDDFTGFHVLDSSSDSSSIFSASDASSYGTDSTKDSNAEDISEYIFGSGWYHP